MKQVGSSQDDVWFKQDLSELFNIFNNLLQNSSPEFRGAQSSLFKNFGPLIESVSVIFEPAELSQIVKTFLVTSSQKYDATLKFINMERLGLVQRIVKSRIFLQEGKKNMDRIFLLYQKRDPYF